MKLLYIINSALSEINKQKSLHIILIICVFACTFFLTWVGVILEPAYLDMMTLESFRDKDVLLLKKSSGTPGMDAAFSSSVKTFQKLSSLENVELSYTMNHKSTIKENRYDILVYSQGLYEKAKIRLSLGKQLYEYEGNNIPVLVTENNSLLNLYGLGDVFDMSLKYGAQNETITVQAEICGIISYPYRYYDGNDLNNLLSWEVLNTQNADTLIVPDFEISNGISLMDSELENMDNSFWYGEITAEEGTEAYTKAYNELQENCSVFTFRELLKESLLNYSEGFSDQLLISVLLLLLIAVGIGSANIYIGKLQIRTFAINFISGAKWTHCLMIDIVRNLIVIILPTLIGSILSAIFFISDLGDQSMFSYGKMNILLILVFMTLLFLISSLPYIIKLKNTEPIAFVRTMNRE